MNRFIERRDEMTKLSKQELEKLILDNREYLYRLAFSYMKNDADAQDAVSEAIVTAYEHLHSVRKKESARAWLMQILVNKCVSILRQKKRESEIQLSIENCSPFEYDELWLVVMELPKDLRYIVVLFYYEQFTTKEISKILKIAEGTVKSRLARARRKLYEFLK